MYCTGPLYWSTVLVRHTGADDSLGFPRDVFDHLVVVEVKVSAGRGEAGRRGGGGGGAAHGEVCRDVEGALGTAPRDHPRLRDDAVDQAVRRHVERRVRDLNSGRRDARPAPLVRDLLRQPCETKNSATKVHVHKHAYTCVQSCMYIHIY